MADVSKIEVNGTSYDIKDANARLLSQANSDDITTVIDEIALVSQELQILSDDLDAAVMVSYIAESETLQMKTIGS